MSAERRLRFSAILAAVLALGSMLLPARSEEPKGRGEHADIRVGLVLDVGGLGDKSFNDAAFIGLSRAARELGVTTELLEPTGAEDREAAMRLFAARGFDLVIGVGFIFSTDVNVVAGLTFREEEGSFLVGAVAGLVTRKRHVGFVGGMDIPLIHKFEAGYRAGALEVCPTCLVHAAYAGATPDAFRDPAKGKALAVSQAAAGADVIYHAAGTTGHGVFEAARDMGIKAIGVDADQFNEMPGTVLTSMIKRADVAVFETIRAVVDERFQSGLAVFGLAEDGVSYVSEGPHAAGIPADVKARVAELRERVIKGSIRVPSR
jgi:basic membrane protein A